MSDPQTPPPPDPIAAALEGRRRKLLDLTRRNRLLNFRPTRRTTVNVIDEIPSELYRLLALDGKTLRFLPGERPAAVATSAAPPVAPEDPPPPPDVEPPTVAPLGKGKTLARPLDPMPTGPDAEALGIEFANKRGRCPFCHDSVTPNEDTAVCNLCLSRMHAECWDEAGRCSSCGGQNALRGSGAATTPAPSDAGAPSNAPDESRTYQRTPREKLQERHRDLDLQTDLPAGDLEANLLAIHRRAASTLEEQGFGALFLALGFLEWTEQGSKVLQKAPVLLVPVELKRRSVRSAFKLSLGDDDPIVNPALAYKLQQDWDVELSSLPHDPEDADPDEVLATLAERVAEIPGWRVTDEASLALFSFSKFVMYKDLQVHQEHFLAHSVVRRLLGEVQATPQANSEAPTTHLVLDADASQREAIEAVLGGDDLVLEGPPGTGKSQTIANLIGCFLARGKSVLFVSEKMAALEVVQSRLEEVGLGAFCLELHSRHSNKRSVVRNLERTLSVELPADHAEDEALRELTGLDGDLDALVSELHDPRGALAASPFQILGALEAPLADPMEAERFITALEGCEAWTRTDLNERVRTLETLGTHLEESGSPRSHACRGIDLEELRHSSRGEIREALTALREDALPGLQAAVSELSQAASAHEPRTLSEIDTVLEWTELLCNPRLPDASVLGNPAWDQEPADAERLIELYARETTLNRRLKGKLRFPLPKKEELLALIAGVEKHYRSWYRIFVPGYWSVRGSVKAICEEIHDPPVDVLLRDLTLGAQAADLTEKLAAGQSTGEALFGARWPGPRKSLEQVGSLAREFRRLMRQGVLGPGTLERLASGRLDTGVLTAGRAELVGRLDGFQRAWGAFQRAAAFDGARGLTHPLAECSWTELAARLEELEGGLSHLADWVELRRSVASAERQGLQAFVDRALDLNLSGGTFAHLLKHAFLMRWLDAALEERHRLSGFDAIDHESRLESFRGLDRRKLRLQRVRLRHQLAARRPDTSWAASEGSELGLLQRELRRKRGHMPVRQLLRKIPTAIRALKPCLLMSPLTVAQFTEPSLHTFDLVIFDEASQIAPEDALGAIARGKQVVVVGDSKQMPPTSFFKAQVATETSELDALPDLESILDECVAQALPRQVLRWHYRSRHESLIAFSNHFFYERRLHTFPSPNDGRGRLGLRSERVEGGVYDRGGSGRNVVEAEAVADAVVSHFQASPTRSLGVGTFSQAQQEAILDAVEQRARRFQWLEPLLSADRDEHFFVKNLENLQGDERDVILVSVGYGPDANGKLSLNFGPLNQAGGERRLNVLITRAREQLVVFTSFEAKALDLSRSQSLGLRLLKNYLEYTETKQLPEADEAGDPAETLDVGGVVAGLRAALESRGLTVMENVGTSNVRVDLAVQENDGFVLGIMVDGPRYAALPSVCDRERLLPSVLEGLRWKLSRVWAMQWHRHPDRVVERLLEELEVARSDAANEQAAADAAAEAAAIAEAAENDAIRLKDASPGESAPVLPYQQLAVTLKGTSAEFTALDANAIRGVLEAVVRAEGPIHVSEAQRRTLAHWDMSRSGKRARSKVDEAATLAADAGALRLEGRFLWPTDLEAAHVRDRSKQGPRDVSLIADEEISAALRIVAHKEIRVASLDLIKRAAKLMGFPRAGKKIQAGMRAVLEALIASGELTEENAVITVPDAG